MKKTSQIIYIVLFLVVIGTGSLFNASKLAGIVKETIKNHPYEAWAIIIGLEYGDEFFDKYFFVNTNGFFHKMLGQHKMKDVVKLDSGKLAIPLEEVSVWQQAQETQKFYQWLTEEEIPFCYVQAPYEICKYESQLPVGVSDFSNQNADNFLMLLADKEIPYLDLRDLLHERGMEHYDAFFRTDHHWKIETAFWAYGVLTDYLEKLLQVEIPDSYSDLESYYVETAPEQILGSNGRRTGIAYAGLEDITLIYPKEKGEMSFSAPDDNIYREGDFQEAYMEYARLEGDNLYEMLQYNIYIGEDYPTTRQICKAAPCDKKVLLIKDSYFRPVQAFLGTAFKQVDTIDMRYFEGDIREYVKAVDPDAVLLCYNPYMLYDHGNFQFIQ